MRSHELCWRRPPESSHLAAAHPKFSSRNKSQILQNSQLEEQLAQSPTGLELGGEERVLKDLSFAGSRYSLPSQMPGIPSSASDISGVDSRGLQREKDLSEFIPVRCVLGSQKWGISRWLQAKQDKAKSSTCKGTVWRCPVGHPARGHHPQLQRRIPEGHRAVQFQSGLGWKGS